MVKMFDKNKIKYLSKRIKYLTTEINFINDYLVLSKNHVIIKNKKLIEDAYLSFQEKIIPYSDKNYLEKLSQEVIDKIKNKYHWKNLELLQRLKRSTDDNKRNQINKKINLLEDELKSQIQEIEKLYTHVEIVPSDKEDFIKIYEKKYIDFKEKIEKKTNIKLHKLNQSAQLKTTNINQMIEKYELELKRIDIDQVQMEMDDAIIKIKNLTMAFGGLKAVDDLSFEVKKGEIFGLIGPNGAGKTTVFNCLTRFYKCTHGEIYYRNSENKVILLNEYKVHNVIKQGISRTFQNVELIWELSILDNLLVAGHSLYRTNFFGHLFSTKRLHQEEDVITKKAQKILHDLNLIQFQHIIPYGLPYGILKRIELARTLMVDTQLIILDEPAAGLNDAETVELAGVIKRIRDEYNTTIFLVEHDMGLVMSICDTVCAISFGKKLGIGTPEEIQNNKQVKEAYLGGE